MAEVLTSEGYSLLLDAYKKGAAFLVEQLTLNRNVPPRTKKIMLYCELRGIISDHDTVEEAGIAARIPGDISEALTFYRWLVFTITTAKSGCA